MGGPLTLARGRILYYNTTSAIFQAKNRKKIVENISCKFCKYKDICYMKEEDIVNIESDNEGVK